MNLAGRVSRTSGVAYCPCVAFTKQLAIYLGWRTPSRLGSPLPKSGLGRLQDVWSGKDESVRNVARSIWAAVQGDAAFMRRLNGWLTIFWIVMIPVSLAMGWLKSVTYVSALSLWALVSGHWSTWQAARVECMQQQEAIEREQNPIEDKVVDRIVERTEVEPAPAAN